jgi:hypothetical protein
MTVGELELRMSAPELAYWKLLFAEEATEAGLSQDQRILRRDLAATKVALKHKES